MLSQYINGRKILAFGYGYSHLIKDKVKTTTVRYMRDRSYKYKVGEDIMVHASYGRDSIDVPARVTAVALKPFDQVTKADLKGESPDSLTPEALRCVLGNLYKEDFSPTGMVQVIRFEYT